MTGWGYTWWGYRHPVGLYSVGLYPHQCPCHSQCGDLLRPDLEIL